MERAQTELLKTELLHTKLVVPPVRAEAVRRTRLEDRLRKGVRRKLTLVSARAGSGKTTLLSSWVARERSRRCAWISLDAEDSELLCFLRYFISSIGRLHEGFGEDLLASFSSPDSPTVEGLMTSLLNQLGEITEDFVVVLDDFHLIAGEQVPEALSAILDRMPSRMHVIVAGRADPALPLAKLRAGGELVELRDAHLRFNHEETI